MGGLQLVAGESDSWPHSFIYPIILFFLTKKYVPVMQARNVARSWEPPPSSGVYVCITVAKKICMCHVPQSFFFTKSIFSWLMGVHFCVFRFICKQKLIFLSSFIWFGFSYSILNNSHSAVCCSVSKVNLLFYFPFPPTSSTKSQ